MGRSTRAALFVLSSLFSGATAVAQGNALAILPINATDLAKPKVDALGDAFATAATDLFKLRVLGPGEVRELLGAGQVKAASNCDNMFCWARLGAAVSASHVLALKATGVGQNILLTATWVEVGEKKVLMRHQQPIRDDLLAFLNEAKGVLVQIGEKVPADLRQGSAGTRVASHVPPPAPAPVPPPPATTPPPKPAPPPPPAETKSAPPAPAQRQSGWLGLGHRNLDEATIAETKVERRYGAYVHRVTDDGPAAKAGVKVGDVLQKINGTVIGSSDDLKRLLSKLSAGDAVEFKVWSERKEKMVNITLGVAPSKD